ncbi:helix-turn-helix domain-containing protein [Streptomyces sp. SPB074]|uniref:helix-turn-helix domain-containing protein n=1 Tax=Streptomyces sp. (strain SPB074) TaxID=465543 RepID=UPI00017F29C3|nr:helix-turn-helix transcriptional regulator [Streptomyces sp. SPB074]EDY46402.1 xre family toxin-antitoxin system, antitoxin component [Streptomyces sp. SPB074]
MAQSDMPTTRSRRLGAELRRLRLEAGLRVGDVAEALECGQPKISQIENGKRGIRPLDLTTFFNLVGVEDERYRNNVRRLARRIHQRDWWAAEGLTLDSTLKDFLTLEADSEQVCAFENAVLPGLLHTEPYMRRVFGAGDGTAGARELTRVRLRRQERLDEGADFRFRAVVDVTVLHRVTGDRALVLGQLAHLLDAAARPNVTLQVLPLDAVPPMRRRVPFQLFSQRGEPPVDAVWLEHLTGGGALEHRSDVAVYRSSWDELTAAALSPSASRRYVRDLMEERAR